MAKKKSAIRSIPKVYEFNVSLVGSSPLVWRRFLAHDIVNLDELHILIQMTMGWEARHLYEFRIGKKSYSSPEHVDESDSENSEGFSLKRALGNQRQFSYIYDFGDDWEHNVEITNVFEHDPRITYPVCTGGENACPPEDCGGVGGFEELKKILAGGNSKEKDEMLEWVGGFFNPTTFDPNLVNRLLLWNDVDRDFDELDS